MRLGRLYRDDNGAVALEAAIVLPMLLPLLLGIYDLGCLCVMSMEVEHATQSAASFAYNVYVKTGTPPSLADIQGTIETQSLPITISISADPARGSLTWTGCPTGTSIASASTCTVALGTFLSIVGSAPTQTTLGTWVGFPANVSAKILVRLK